MSKPGAPQVLPDAPGNIALDYQFGDSARVAEAFAKAAHVTKLDFINNRLIPNAIEPRAAIDLRQSAEILTAIRQQGPTVLLVDETDKADVEVEGLLLEVLSEFQVTVPELGTIAATHTPFVVLTSNATRELSEALKRRCLFLHIDYPEIEREREIVLTKVPDISDHLADQVARIVRTIRNLELKKAPSVSETLDWANTLVLLGVQNITEAEAVDTLHILLKYQSDIAKAAKELTSTPSKFQKTS